MDQKNKSLNSSIKNNFTFPNKIWKDYPPMNSKNNHKILFNLEGNINQNYQLHSLYLQIQIKFPNLPKTIAKLQIRYEDL